MYSGDDFSFIVVRLTPLPSLSLYLGEQGCVGYQQQRWFDSLVDQVYRMGHRKQVSLQDIDVDEDTAIVNTVYRLPSPPSLSSLPPSFFAFPHTLPHTFPHSPINIFAVNESRTPHTDKYSQHHMSNYHNAFQSSCCSSQSSSSSFESGRKGARGSGAGVDTTASVLTMASFTSIRSLSTFLHLIVHLAWCGSWPSRRGSARGSAMVVTSRDGGRSACV